MPRALFLDRNYGIRVQYEKQKHRRDRFELQQEDSVGKRQEVSRIEIPEGAGAGRVMMIDCGLSELATSALIRNVRRYPRLPAHLVGDPLESGETNFLDSFIGGFAI